MTDAVLTRDDLDTIIHSLENYAARMEVRPRELYPSGDRLRTRADRVDTVLEKVRVLQRHRG